MAETGSSYQPKVGIEQGAGTIYVREDGNFKFYDTDRTGVFLRNWSRSERTKTVTGISNVSLLSGTAISGPPTISPAYGYHVFNATAAVSVGSCDIHDASEGNMLVIDGYGFISGASIVILQTGINSASIYNHLGSRLSSILIKSDDPYLKMICSTDGQWSIVEAAGAVTLQADA